MATPAPAHGDLEAASGIDLRTVIAANDIVVIGRTTCPFCIEAHRALADLGAPSPAVFNVDTMGARGAALRAEATALTGHTTVPMIWIAGEFIGGCTELKLLVSGGGFDRLADRFKGARDPELGASAADGTTSPVKPAAASGGGAAGEARAVDVYPGPQAAVRLWLQYPSTVDGFTVRVMGLLTALICALLVAFGDDEPLGWWAIGFTADFALRLFGGAAMSPIGALAIGITSLVRYRKEPLFRPGAPKMFAMFCGLLVSGTAAGLYLAHYWLLGRIFLGLLMFLAFLEGAFNFCAGCVIFGYGIRLGIVPETIHRLYLQTLHEKRYQWNWAHTYTTDGHAPASVTHRTAGLPANPTDLKAKPRLDSDKWQWFNPIKYVAPCHFAIPVGISSAGLPWAFMGSTDMTDVSDPISWASLAVFLALAILFIIKIALYPRKIVRDMVHPMKAAAFAMPPIYLLILSALRRHDASQEDFADALFWMGAVSALAVALLHLAALVARPWSPEVVNTSWLVPPLACLFAAIVSTQVTSTDVHDFAQLLLGYAIVMYLALWPPVLTKAISSPFADYRERYSIVVWSALPAAFGLAFYTVEGWAIALQYCLMASVALACVVLLAVGPFGFMREGKFDVKTWALSFPINIIATVSVVYNQMVESAASKFLQAATVGFSGFVTVTLCLLTINSIVNGGFFVPMAKWGPFSSWMMAHEAIRAEIVALRAALAEVGGPRLRTLARYSERVARLAANVATHAAQEEEVIFPFLSLYFPGLEDNLDGEHGQFASAYAAHAAALKALSAAPTAATADALLSDLKRDGDKMLAALAEHLQHEEYVSVQPVVRKYLNITETRRLVRDVWDATPRAALAEQVAWVLTHVPMHPQRVRYVKALLWAMPERAQLIGLMAYRGVDDATWVQLSADVPEITPRGLPGHRRYY